MSADPQVASVTLSEAVAESRKRLYEKTRQELLYRARQLVGCAQVATLANCHQDTIDKACAGSRDLTAVQVESLIQSGGALKTTFDFQTTIDDLARRFIPPGRRLIGDEVLVLLRKCVEAMEGSGRLEARGGSCPSCFGPVTHVGFINGKPVYECTQQCLPREG